MAKREKTRTSGISFPKSVDKILNWLAKKHGTSRSVIVGVAVRNLKDIHIQVTSNDVAQEELDRGVKHADA